MKSPIEEMFGAMYGQTNAGEIAALKAKVSALEAKLATAEKTIATLRHSKDFYQDNYRKAKAAYERVVKGDA